MFMKLKTTIKLILFSVYLSGTVIVIVNADCETDSDCPTETCCITTPVGKRVCFNKVPIGDPCGISHFRTPTCGCVHGATCMEWGASSNGLACYRKCSSDTDCNAGDCCASYYGTRLMTDKVCYKPLKIGDICNSPHPKPNCGCPTSSKCVLDEVSNNTDVSICKAV